MFHPDQSRGEVAVRAARSVTHTFVSKGGLYVIHKAPWPFEGDINCIAIGLVLFEGYYFAGNPISDAKVTIVLSSYVNGPSGITF